MTMGLLDLPAPVFGAIEAAVADHAPPLLRLGLWAAVAALASIELYRLLSPQRRINAAMRRLQQAQRALAGFDGEFNEALPLMGRMLRASGLRLALVFPAAIAASLPILALLVWLDGAYGARFPDAGQPVAVHARPGGLEARWEGAASGAAGSVVVTDASRRPVVQAEVAAPVPTIHKWKWWNALIGNPAGYLPQEAPVDRIDIELPRLEVLSLGPAWMRGWEVPFFALFLTFALVAKWARKVV